MARTSAGGLPAHGIGEPAEGGVERTADVMVGRAAVDKARFEAVMRAAEQAGLLNEKSGRIAGRVSPALVEQAKRQTGIHTDTDLIEFALATVALEDNFAEVFRESRGKVDPEVKLGF
ncbi:MAG: hypothetical protein U1E35_00480 [Rhodospirillales bacterium]